VNLLEPWVLLRVIAGIVTTAFFVRAAATSVRVLRHFDLGSYAEGQLALERQVELASTFVRVATAMQFASLALSALAADRLSHGIRGAMCAYGVFNANEWGFRALASTVLVAVLGGILAQIYAFDARTTNLALVRKLSVFTLILAPLAAVDLALTSAFLLKLDLSITASCCSVQLDAAAAGNGGFAHGPRILAATLAPIAIVVAMAVAFAALRRPKAPLVFAAGLFALVAFPLAVGAAVLEVAPYAFELPQHVCPFCLLKADVLGIGYPLFGSILFAVIWGAGAAVVALIARDSAAREAFESFVRSRLRREIAAWSICLILCILPVVRYAWVTGAVSLFP
jgi:hypothetical protein